jgi:hypothetical protein
VAVGIGNDWEGDLGVADFVDVLDPFVVRCEVVGALRDVLAIDQENNKGLRRKYQANHLHAASIELRLQLCECSKLGCADGSEVCRVGE